MAGAALQRAAARARVRHTGLEPQTRRRADRQTGRQGPRQLCYSRVWDPLALDRHRVLHRDLKTQNVFLTAAVLLALTLTLSPTPTPALTLTLTLSLRLLLALTLTLSLTLALTLTLA